MDYDGGVSRFAQMDIDQEQKQLHIIELERNRTNKFIVEEWYDFNEVYMFNLKYVYDLLFFFFFHGIWHDVVASSLYKDFDT